MKTIRILSTAASMILVASIGPLNAQVLVHQNRPAAGDVSPSEYWTAERMASAKQETLVPAYYPASQDANVTGTPSQSAAWAPSAAPAMSPVQFYNPNDVKATDDVEVATGSEKFGTQNARFSSTRLVPQTADTVYPHRVIGKLFFTKPGIGNFVCSAALVQRRVIATAGHCVHRGSGGAAGFYTNFSFVPALRSGVGPWGAYGWAYVAVTTTWATGAGAVPNAADYAMIELTDHSGVRAGALLGYLGWITLSLSGNHANLMGYPCNLDNCNLMHQVTAGAYSNAANNTVIYGSDMRGGSSGGPWIQNFGLLATCTAGCGGSLTGLNQVIAVTSYGPIATTPLYEGASIPDSRWVAVYNAICAHRAGNCTP
jgi:V8-like Glu-specific endopeptidase